MSEIQSVILQSNISNDLKNIAKKVFNNQRISVEDGIMLYNKGEVAFLGALANFVREQQNGNRVYFNRNFHIEPTNICLFDCKFCSYSRLLKQNQEAW